MRSLTRYPAVPRADKLYIIVLFSALRQTFRVCCSGQICKDRSTHTTESQNLLTTQYTTSGMRSLTRYPAVPRAEIFVLFFGFSLPYGRPSEFAVRGKTSNLSIGSKRKYLFKILPFLICIVNALMQNLLK